jgi:hypothetical protein
MKRFALGVVKYTAALAFASASSLISLSLATLALIVAIAILFTKRRQSGRSWLKPLVYVLLVAAIGAWYARYGLTRAPAPASCADLTPRVIRAFMPAEPPPAAVVTSSPAAFSRQIDGEIVRLLRQIDDVKDATTIITDARRIAQYTENEETSAALRTQSDALEMLLRSTNLLTQSDIETRAARLQSTLDAWHSKVADLQPEADFTALRRDFNEAVVQDSFDQVSTGLVELRHAINQFVAREGLAAEQRLVAYFDEAASMWVLNESIWFTTKAVELIELDASDVTILSKYEDAPPEQIMIGTGTVSLPVQPKSIPIPPNQGTVELRTVWRVPGTLAQTCGRKSFSTLLPFWRTDLSWPQLTDTLVRGRVKLAKPGLDNVPFTMTIDRRRPLNDIGVPQYSLFASSAPNASKGSIRYDERVLESVGLSEENVSAQSLSIRPVRFELLPRLFRYQWIHENRNLIFPLSPLLGAAYLLVTALLSEYLFRR